MSNHDPQYPAGGPAAGGAGRPAGVDDLEHLRLLSIFHFIVAGLVGLFSLLPIFQLVLFGFILSDPEVQGEPAARVALGLALTVVVGLILAALTFAACLALAGRYLARQSHYTFCLVTAAVSCVIVPVGTVLGVFTLLVLLRPSVKERFGVAAAR